MVTKLHFISFFVTFLVILILLSKYRTNGQIKLLLSEYDLNKTTINETDFLITGLTDEATILTADANNKIKSL